MECECQCNAYIEGETTQHELRNMRGKKKAYSHIKLMVVCALCCAIATILHEYDSEYHVPTDIHHNRRMLLLSFQ